MICTHCGKALSNNDDATHHAGECPSEEPLPKAEAAANWWAARLKEESGVDRDEFIANFLKLYQEYKPTKLRVDYDPCDFLYTVLETCGWESKALMFTAKNVFPAKRSMLIKSDHLVVSDGYAAQFQHIMVSKEIQK